MSQLLIGSINFDALLESLKTNKIKTYKSDSGVRLVNVNVWLNEEPDKWGNDATIQLQVKEGVSRNEVKTYIGKLKKYVKKDPTPASADDFLEVDDDLPF